MLGGVGEALAFDAELLDDLRTAVSEACNNVVMHAYGDEIGPLLVDCEITPDRVEVTVRDHGEGIRTAAPTTDRMGVGLAVISALSERAEFVRAPDGGTEVRMSFTGGMDTGALPVGADLGGEDWPTKVAGRVVVRLAPAQLLAGVLGRIVRAVAARARFSVDRFSDLYSVTEALSAHARTAASSDRIAFAVDSAERRLELRIGPFEKGSSESLQGPSRAAASSSPLGLLADEIGVEQDGTQELLRLVVADKRAR
jgi:serine/threonine-protein kinase RsbW